MLQTTFLATVLPKQCVVTAPLGDIQWFYQEFHLTFVPTIYLVS